MPDEMNHQNCCGGQDGACCVESQRGPFFWPKLALFLVLIVAGLLLIRNWYKSYDYIGKGNVRDTIYIDGLGKVTAIPDVATFSVGVQTQKIKVNEAQKENTDKMNKIISALKELGVVDADIQTSEYNIYPQYDWSTGTSVLLGYQVSQTVTVKVRDLEKVGDIFARAGELGANNVGSLQFTIDEPEKYRQEARFKALANAKEKAEALANAAGVKLGKVVGFSENQGSNSYPTPMYDLGMGGAAKAESAPSVQVGSTEIIMNVSVNYEVL